MANLLLSIAFLVYLCVLDYLFVFKMNEQKSVLNDMGLLIASMPMVGAVLTFKYTSTIGSTLKRMMLSLITVVVMIIVGILEYLWVATHFHSMLGGNI